MLIKYVQRFHLILFLLVITYGCSSNPNSKFDNRLNEWMNGSKSNERNIRQKKMFEQLYGWDKAREKGMKYCKLLTEGVTEQEILVTESVADKELIEQGKITQVQSDDLFLLHIAIRYAAIDAYCPQFKNNSLNK